MRLLYFILVVLSTFHAYANVRPDWVRVFPKETSEFKFYVGRAESNRSQIDALNQAMKNAYDQALKANFGVQVQIDAQTYQTERDVYLTERMSEKTKNVLIEDFDKIDEYFEKNHDTFKAYALYRYSKKAIQTEKKRLADLPVEALPKSAFSVVGNVQNASRGTLEVRTYPIESANVFIDGERYGTTPLRLIGALEAGRHILRIDHKKYETVTENIIIVPNKIVHINKNLIPATTDVSITTAPAGAEVFFNSQKQGVSPLKIKAYVDKKNELKIKHPEMEETSSVFEVEKESPRNLHFTLIPKASKISVFSFPEGASVFLDYQKIGQTPLRSKVITQGVHTLSIEKTGFVRVLKNVSIKGGEELKENIHLTKAQNDTALETTKKRQQVDKYHRFSEILPQKSTFILPSEISTDKILEKLLNWDYPASFLRASISYNLKMSKGSADFAVKLYFDEQEYNSKFVLFMEEILHPLSENSKKETLPMTCRYSDTVGLIGCGINSFESAGAIYVQQKKVKHSFWSDEADFMRYQIPMLRMSDNYYTQYKSAQNEAHKLKAKTKSSVEKKLLNFEKYVVVLSVFDISNKKVFNKKQTFFVQKHVVTRGGSILFAPRFFTNTKERLCSKAANFYNTKGSPVECGFSELVFYTLFDLQDKPADVMIDRVEVEIKKQVQGE